MHHEYLLGIHYTRYLIVTILGLTISSFLRIAADQMSAFRFKDQTLSLKSDLVVDVILATYLN